MVRAKERQHTEQRRVIPCGRLPWKSTRSGVCRLAVVSLLGQSAGISHHTRKCLNRLPTSLSSPVLLMAQFMSMTPFKTPNSSRIPSCFHEVGNLVTWSWLTFITTFPNRMEILLALHLPLNSRHPKTELSAWNGDDFFNSTSPTVTSYQQSYFSPKTCLGA